MNVFLQGYKKVTGVIQDAKEVWIALATIVVGTVLALAWMFTTFNTAAQADVSHKQLMEATVQADNAMAVEIKNLAGAIAVTNGLITLHMEKHSLDAVNLAIQNNDTEIWNLEQAIPRTEQVSKRLIKLKNQREEMLIKRECIIHQNPRCDS